MPILDNYCRVKPQYLLYPYTPQFVVCPHCSKKHEGKQELREVLTCNHCKLLFITTDIGCFNSYNSSYCKCIHPFIGNNKRLWCGISSLPVKQQFTANSKIISVFKIRKYENQNVYHGSIPECLSSLFLHGILSPCELNGVRTHGFHTEKCTKYVGLDYSAAESHSKGLVVESSFSGYVLDASEHFILSGELNNLLLSEFKIISGIQYKENGQSIVFRNDVQLQVPFNVNYKQARVHFTNLSFEYKRKVVMAEFKRFLQRFVSKIR